MLITIENIVAFRFWGIRCLSPSYMQGAAVCRRRRLRYEKRSITVRLGLSMSFHQKRTKGVGTKGVRKC